jgi:hypothetical protein
MVIAAYSWILYMNCQDATSLQNSFDPVKLWEGLQTLKYQLMAATNP